MMITGPTFRHIRQLLKQEVDETSLQSVVMRTGGNWRRMYAVLHETEAITASMADRLITHLWGPHLWHTDPVLAEWYEPQPGVQVICPGRISRLNCRQCSGHLDEKTPGCRTCWDRHRQRRMRNRRWAA